MRSPRTRSDAAAATLRASIAISRSSTDDPIPIHAIVADVLITRRSANERVRQVLSTVEDNPKLPTKRTPYAMTLDFGDESRDPSKHLAALLVEARGEIDSLPPDGDIEGLRAWGAEVIQRDAMISRCALILAERMLRSAVKTGTWDEFNHEHFEQIEIAMEWLYRG